MTVISVLNMAADENVRPRGVEIEKKIEYLESLAGNVNFFLILFIYLFMVNCNLCFLYGNSSIFVT